MLAGVRFFNMWLCTRSGPTALLFVLGIPISSSCMVMGSFILLWFLTISERTSALQIEG